jgi:hypothetical protein
VTAAEQHRDAEPGCEAAERGSLSHRPHPDFDGHLEYPVERMTDDERIEWIWQMMLLRAAAADPKSR